jgi:hypothetical protein
MTESAALTAIGMQELRKLLTHLRKHHFFGMRFPWHWSIWHWSIGGATIKPGQTRPPPKTNQPITTVVLDIG